MGPTETLAQFVVDTRLRDIPGKAVEISKLVVLDLFGVTLAASRQPIARILADYLREIGAAPKAGVIGSDLRTEVSLAAWANGALAFALPFSYGNLMMAASFGLLHIVFGAIIAKKYGG